MICGVVETERLLTADGSVAELRESGSLSGEEVVPGFACAVADLFAEL